MKRETYVRIQAAVAAFVGIGAAVAVLQNSIYLALGFVIFGMAVLYLSSRRVKGVIKDEMVHRIAGKASWRAFQIFVPFAAFLGLSIVVTGWLPEFYQAAQALVYSALALMALYALFYGYYSRKGDV